MIKQYRVLFTIIFCLLMYLILNPGKISVPIENLAIPAGFAVDLEADEKGNKHYHVNVDLYTFNKKNEVKNIILDGEGKNFLETREQRQLKANHKTIIGMEKVILYSEDIAKNGLSAPLDILFSNPFISDMGWLVICKGKAVDILKFKVADYPTSADYIEGMIESNREQHFFSDNYKLIDAFVRVDAEGRSLVLPYLAIKADKLQIVGTALFKRDKMIGKLNIEDTKTMNFLRENNVRGFLTKQTDFNKHISLYGKVSRKVRCKKITDNKYIFDLDLEYKGDVISNTLKENFLQEPEEISQFENILALETEKKCYEFIKKMQTVYKVDCLELGRVAAAKYGRQTGTDWDKTVSNSEIKIRVKVKVDRLGRGQYTMKTK